MTGYIVTASSVDSNGSEFAGSIRVVVMSRVRAVMIIEAFMGPDHPLMSERRTAISGFLAGTRESLSMGTRVGPGRWDQADVSPIEVEP